MTKRARSPSPRTARTSAHPLRLLATLPPLDTRPAGIAEPADPPAGAERAHCAVSASLHFSPAPPAGGLAEGCAATVYAAENALVLWDAANARGLSVPYEKIAIHAIARASETEKGCVYIQLLGADMVDAEGNAVAAPTGDAPDEGDSDEKDPRYDDDEDEMLEIRLVPEKEEDLDQIFLGLSICAELHPDPSLSDSEGFPIFAANGAEAQMGAEASANHAMAALLAAGDQIGKPGGPSLSELLGPGWITADSLNAAEGGDEEDMEGDEGEEGEGDEGGDEDAEGAEEDAEDVEGRFEDAEE